MWHVELTGVREPMPWGRPSSPATSEGGRQRQMWKQWFLGSHLAHLNALLAILEAAG